MTVVPTQEIFAFHLEPHLLTHFIVCLFLFYLSTPWTVLQLIKNIESGYVAMNLNVLQIHQFKSNKLLQSRFSNNHLILSRYL